ncbi:uncharacterized protein LOC105840710 [Monomorium pharaonis]|uniref:uncharacterized protein LOC105840710 n=1 Tax=Monomorium pharaonis TaxID=307658 RepID=UPI00063F9EDD|nr:uncharacterized protein LOC105840710 [Monomorium pharaonis]
MVDLNEYRESVQQIRRYAAVHNVSEEQTSKIFQACFRQLEAKYARKSSSKSSRPLRIILSLALVTIVLLCLLNYNQNWLNAVFIRISQNSIYPALYLLRKVAIPFISLYPSLTELYDEWCLIENPYFYVNDMDCWPCTMVHSVLDLTGHNISRSFNIGIPYTRAENNTRVKMKDLFNLYWNNRDIFDEDAKRISSNNGTFKTIRDVMNNRLDTFRTVFFATHVSWRVNRMRPNRLLRKLFPKPVEAPNWWSQSTEKYIFIDESSSPPYSLPNPECSNIVIRCAAGARLIKMIPSSECSQHCKSSTILLSAGHTLWYNWWYWRPMSLPVYNATDFSIGYLTSFC